jgi:hypothetical protein
VAKEGHAQNMTRVDVSKMQILDSKFQRRKYEQGFHQDSMYSKDLRAAWKIDE